MLSANAGAIGRLNAAAPLARGGDPLPAKIARAEAFAESHGIAPCFRVVDALADRDTIQALKDAGYVPEDDPVLIMALPMPARPPAPPLQIVASPSLSAPWRAVFEGEGFDKADSAARAETYARAPGMAFLTGFRGTEAVAAGLAAPFGGLVGVHGMRTARGARGLGYASAIIAAIAANAGDNAAALFLHVSASNTNAAALYQRLGFRQIGSYAYWRKTG